MNATITALRPGRTVALVQRKRRRMHLASIGAGETAWLSLCDRPITALDADFHNPDMATALDEHGDAMCRECYRHLALAIYLHATSVTRIHSDIRTELKTGIAR